MPGVWRIARCKRGHFFITRSDVDRSGKMVNCPVCGEHQWCVMVLGPFRKRKMAEILLHTMIRHAALKRPL